MLLQDSMSESAIQENGFVAVENVKISDIPDNTSLSADLYVGDRNGCCFIIRLLCVQLT